MSTDAPYLSKCPCRKCGKLEVWVTLHEDSECHEDYHCVCKACGASHWEEGADY